MIGLFLIPPLMIGYWAGENEIIRRPGVVTVDIMKYEDEICVYEHYKGELIFKGNHNSVDLTFLEKIFPDEYNHK